MRSRPLVPTWMAICASILTTATVLNRRQRSQQWIRNPDCFALSKRDQHTSWSLDFRLSLLPPVNNRFALQSTKEAGQRLLHQSRRRNDLEPRLDSASHPLDRGRVLHFGRSG